VTPRGRRRARLAGLSLAAAAVAGVLLALELALRLLAPQTFPLEGLFRNDPVCGLRHVPGFHGTLEVDGARSRVVIDGRGFRALQGAPAPVPAAHRVLVLGDSFAFGQGVSAEEALPGRMQRALGPQVDVVNAGHCGYGPDNEALLLGQEGPALRPGLVLLVFYAGNDLWNVLAGPDRAWVLDGVLVSRPGLWEQWDRPLEPGRIVPRYLASAPAPPASRWRRLLLRSHAWRFLSRRGAALRGKAASSAFPAPRPLTPLDDEAVFIRRDPPEFTEGWARVHGLLRQMDAWSRAHGARFAVAVVPAAVQVDPARWEAARRAHSLREEDFDLEKPQRLLAAQGAADGFAVVDLLPALRDAAAPGGDPLYFARDPHWTARGHEVAAGALLAALRARGLLP